MLAPLDDQLALDAAQQCRALRIEVQQHSKTPWLKALRRLRPRRKPCETISKRSENHLKTVEKPARRLLPRSFQHLQRHKRQLHDEEFYQLLRQQQELLEDQKKQLEEHQRLVLEKASMKIARRNDHKAIKALFWVRNGMKRLSFMVFQLIRARSGTCGSSRSRCSRTAGWRSAGSSWRSSARAN